MGLLDSIGKGVMGQLSGGKEQNNLLGAVAQLLNSSNIGGLGGLAQLFDKQGKGDIMQSWISKQQNRSISPDELQGVLGQERVQQVAQTAGVSEQDASRGLSDLLPQLVDKLTPNGTLPERNEAGGMLSQLANNFLKH